MTQFDAESLARVLSQVEREVLIEALENANLTQFLTNAQVETLDEVAGWLNLAANVLILAPALRDLVAEQIIQEAIRGPLPAPAVTRGLTSTISWFLTLESKLDNIGALVDQLISPEEGVPEDLTKYVTLKTNVHRTARKALSLFNEAGEGHSFVGQPEWPEALRTLRGLTTIS